MVAPKTVLEPGATPEIRIKRLNADKSRKDVGSATVYHLYFELTAHPPVEWVTLFGQEWEKLQMGRSVEVDAAFLVVHGELREVHETLLSALKQAAAKANAAYGQYAISEASALERREDVWKQERKDVDTLAASLRFD
ncbi:MAG: hypothetical protein MUE68_02555 [Bacteroidetes bacterium]|jgi:hypothetical protein|nr:hypothetical protein [Bacteroidota bacterium]